MLLPSTSFLEKWGLLNIHAPDLGGFYGERETEILVGFCSSRACNGAIDRKLGAAVLFGADARKKNPRCPACGMLVQQFCHLNKKELEKAKTRYREFCEQKRQRETEND